MTDPVTSYRHSLAGLAFVAVSIFGAVMALWAMPETSSGEAMRWSLPWVPSLGIHLSFYLDGLSLLFVLLICGIGAFVGIYANAYMHGTALLGRFFVYLMAFQASMLGLVLADNVITLFVFWELTTITSYLLIGFDNASPEARRKAWQALLVTGLGGLALLAGLLLLAAAGGSMELSELGKAGDIIRADPLYAAILILILAGAFTKSAQFPFHFWLPNAMAAPTPVSAYLHSATMVKAGHLPARPPASRSRGNAGMDLDLDDCRGRHRPLGIHRRVAPDRSEACAGLYYRDGAGHVDDVPRLRSQCRDRRRDYLPVGPRALQMRSVSRRRVPGS